MAKQIQTGIEIQKPQGIHNPVRKRLFTLKESGNYLGRSEWGMRDLIWKQIIPVVKQPGSRKIYIDITDLDGFIEKNKSVYH